MDVHVHMCTVMEEAAREAAIGGGVGGGGVLGSRSQVRGEGKWNWVGKGTCSVCALSCLLNSVPYAYNTHSKSKQNHSGYLQQRNTIQK